MDKPIAIGLDLAKDVLQVHGVDTDGAIVCRRQVRRSQVLAFFSRLGPCLVGMEACAGAHDWARGLTAVGHDYAACLRQASREARQDRCG